MEERQSRLTDSVGLLQGESTRLGRAAEDHGAIINSLRDSNEQMLRLTLHALTLTLTQTRNSQLSNRSRILSAENKSTLASKVCATENSARLGQLTDLTQQTAQLKIDLAQLSHTIEGVAKDASRAAKDADAALQHALSVRSQPPSIFGNLDPAVAAQRNVGRDQGESIVALPVAASGFASPEGGLKQDNNVIGGRGDFRTVSVVDADSELHPEHSRNRNYVNNVNHWEKNDPTPVTSFSDDEDDEQSLSQIGSPDNQPHSTIRQVSSGDAKARGDESLLINQPSDTKAVKTPGYTTTLDFENSFDESVVSADQDSRNDNIAEPIKTMGSDVLQIPSLASEPPSPAKSESFEDSESSSHRGSHSYLDPNSQSPSEVTHQLPSMQNNSSNDSDSDSNSEIDNSMQSDWDDESSQSRVGAALSSSNSANIVSIQATSNSSTNSTLPPLDRQDHERQASGPTSEDAGTRQLDVEVAQEDLATSSSPHIAEEPQDSHHVQQSEEPISVTSAVNVAAGAEAEAGASIANKGASSPTALIAKERTSSPVASIAEEIASSSSSSSSNVDSAVRSSLTVDTSVVLNTSVPSSRATSPGKLSSAATPSAPLSIK